jgi:hypothetical protein
MATTKTSNLTDAQGKAGKNVPNRIAKGQMVEAKDLHAYTAGQLALNEVLLTNVKIPSNAIVSEVLIYNEDLDTGAALAMDFGYAASQKFRSFTSGVVTVHEADDILDADALVDGATDAQAATTSYTSLALDAVTRGPAQAHEAVWETLGYDKDPNTEFVLAITIATGAGTPAAGSLAVMVRYSTDG